ncbi:MAG: hypothetical protein IPM91_03200 [Bacteroidetes bacterium]|nr:hypothetical protein [Bacteroidota bacterium]
MEIMHFRTKAISYNLVFLILFLPNIIIGQNYTLIGDRAFGTLGGETYPLLSKVNNRIIIGGNTPYTGINGDRTEISCSTNPSDFDVWILMLDESLNIAWDKTIGGLMRDEIHGLEFISIDTIVLTGETFSDSSCDIRAISRGGSDLWFTMLDSSGNKLLVNRYGSSNGDKGGRLVRSSNKDYLIFGGSGGGISGDKTTPGYGGMDFWLVKTDSIGNKLWDQTYGGVSNESTIFQNDYFVQECSNSTLILGGRTMSFQSGTITASGYGLWDAWITKTDNLGNQLWDKMYGGNGTDAFCIVSNYQMVLSFLVLQALNLEVLFPIPDVI